MKRNLNIIKIISFGCLAFFISRSFYCGVCDSDVIGCIVQRTKYLDYVSCFIAHGNAFSIFIPQYIATFLGILIVCVIIGVSTPFKIVYLEILSVLILMVDTRKIKRIRDKCLGNYSVNVFVVISSIFRKCHHRIIVGFTQMRSKYSSRKMTYKSVIAIRFTSNNIVWKSFNCPNIRNNIQSFISFDWFPIFLFHNTKSVPSVRTAVQAQSYLQGTISLKRRHLAHTFVLFCKDTKKI